MDSFINLDDLYTRHIQIDKNKLKIYEEIYKKCVRKINKTNKELKKLECFYRVPPYCFGGPIYNYQDLKKYLQFKLFENGVWAEFIDGETIYISWKPEHINRNRYQSKLGKIKNQIDRKYNISENKVQERTIKHKKGSRDNVTEEATRVGVLQYSDKIKDLIPINPKKLHKYKPLDGFPTADRADYYQTMMMRDREEKHHRGDYLANKWVNYTT